CGNAQQRRRRNQGRVTVNPAAIGVRLRQRRFESLVHRLLTAPGSTGESAAPADSLRASAPAPPEYRKVLAKTPRSGCRNPRSRTRPANPHRAAGRWIPDSANTCTPAPDAMRKTIHSASGAAATAQYRFRDTKIRLDDGYAQKSSAWSWNPAIPP